MLLSGTDNHLAGVGVMSEQRANAYERWNKRGHEGYLSKWSQSVSLTLIIEPLSDCYLIISTESTK
jgi:hypothetical protein